MIVLGILLDMCIMVLYIFSCGVGVVYYFRYARKSLDHAGLFFQHSVLEGPTSNPRKPLA
jgi:hypothetical protein